MPKRWMWWCLAVLLLLAAGVRLATVPPPPFANTQAFLDGEPGREFFAAISGNTPPPSDRRAACLEFYRQCFARLGSMPPGFLDALPEWNQETRRIANDALTGTFILQGVTATVPHFANGVLDWNWRGPNNDPEFAWFLNRLEAAPALFVAWRETGDERYRTALNHYLQQWVLENPRPRENRFSSSWRALEAARRVVSVWLPLLFNPQAGQALDPDTIVLLLASLPEHAVALREQHSFSGNHLITEMTALATVALAFPEFKESPSWLDYALAQAHVELHRQFYPDGAQTELANLYQQVVLVELQRLADMLAAAGRDKELAEFRPGIERGWDYYARTMDPFGHGPLNNDSSIEDDAALLRHMAEIYHRSDWLHIASHSAEGTPPPGLPTTYFPYAGLAVMRAGWGGGHQWAYFDMGPYGTDHQHADRLHLSVGGGGREFLVDDGRYIYQPGVWRDYFTGPRGHNVLLLDGQGTMRAPNFTQSPVNIRHEITPGHDFFAATAPFAGDALHGQGPAYHTRAVLYVRDGYWIVADRMLAIGPHKLEALWHFHSDCTVHCDGDFLCTTEIAQMNFGLLAANPPPGGWAVELVRGREGASPQGWYSPGFNTRLPAVCADFSATIESPHTFVWVLWTVPGGRDVPSTRPQVQITADTPQKLSLRVLWPDGRADSATLPFAAAELVAWRRTLAPARIASDR